MDKQILEEKIFESKDSDLINFLDENYNPKKVKSSRILTNLNTYKAIVPYKKRVLNARLIKIEEKYNFTAALASILAVFMGLVAFLSGFTKSIPSLTVGMIIVFLVIASVILYFCAFILRRQKTKLARVKYLISLLKDY